MSTLAGIINDRFFMTANAMVYNPADAQVRYDIKP